MKYLTTYIFSFLVLFNVSLTQNFDLNQSQQQAVYFIDFANLDDNEISNEDSILARTESGLLVGVSKYNGYGTDLVVMGRDLDILIDGQPYSVCETTGTCEYPIMRIRFF